MLQTANNFDCCYKLSTALAVRVHTFDKWTTSTSRKKSESFSFSFFTSWASQTHTRWGLMWTTEEKGKNQMVNCSKSAGILTNPNIWSMINYFSNNIFAPTPLQHNSIGKLLGCLTWLAFILQPLGSFHPLLLVSKSSYVYLSKLWRVCVNVATCICHRSSMYFSDMTFSYSAFPLFLPSTVIGL